MARLPQMAREWVFSLVMAGCALFVVLTMAAMLAYPGGTATNPTTSGYSFFANVLSELGMTETYAGRPNTVSRVLFTTALCLTGAGLVVFFPAFGQFFTGSTSGRVLSAVGSLFGVVSGLSLAGSAFAPLDLQEPWHDTLVTCAFSTFAAAAVSYASAIRREPGYPDRFALVFDAFSLVLLVYLLLVLLGPPRSTPLGMQLKATVQKIIVYASVTCIFIQAYGAKKLAGQSAGSGQR